MRFPVPAVSSGVVVLATLMLLAATSPALADKGRGRHGGGHHGGGHGNSGFHIGLSPGGLSYGYHSRGFSIDLGPSTGSYGYHPSYYQPNYYSASPDDYLPSDYYAPPDYGYSSGPIVYPEPVSSLYGYSVVDDTQPPYSAPPNANGDAPTVLPPPEPVAPTPIYQPGTATSTVVPTNEQAAAFQHNAEQAFRNGQYAEALRMGHHAIVRDRSNGKLLLFRAQVEFAVGDYVAAVGSLEQAMALVPASDRGFVVQHYVRLYKGRAYVEQMDRLVQYSKAHPQADYALALRAYHYLHLGHERAAQDLLQPVAELPGDTRIAGGLITTLRSELDVPPRPTPEPTIDVRPTGLE